MKRGYFISFEGVDGSGKSTQIQLLRSFLESRGCEVLLTREPGGTDIGEKIRKIILDPANAKMTHMTEALLYAASRAQHVSEVIRPAVEAGRVVICDRFVDSSIAYQGSGRGLGGCVADINRYAVDGCVPDITFLMKVRPDVGSDRISGRSLDRIEMENAEFYRRVYEGYEQLEKEFPDRIIGIDATGDIDAIGECIASHVEHLMGYGR